MEALEYLREQKRMCNSYENCDGCPAWDDSCKLDPGEYLECEEDEKLKIVNEWSVSHSIKTRQSKFLEMFPNASVITNGTLGICPKSLDKDRNCFYSTDYGNSKFVDCLGCRNQFWLEEVDE